MFLESSRKTGSLWVRTMLAMATRRQEEEGGSELYSCDFMSWSAQRVSAGASCVLPDPQIACTPPAQRQICSLQRAPRWTNPALDLQLLLRSRPHLLLVI